MFPSARRSTGWRPSGARCGNATASTASTVRPRASGCSRSTRPRRRSAARCTWGTCSPTPTPTRRPLPADARQGRVLPDGLGRQRSADRAARAESLRRALRPVGRLRPAVRASRGAFGEGAGIDLAPQLRGAVPGVDGVRRAGVRGAVAHARPVGRLVDDVHDDRPTRPAGLAAIVPGSARPRRGLPAAGADAVGRGLPDGGRPGRAGGSRAAGGDARVRSAGRPAPARLGPMSETS